MTVLLTLGRCQERFVFRSAVRPGVEIPRWKRNGHGWAEKWTVVVREIWDVRSGAKRQKKSENSLKLVTILQLTIGHLCQIMLPTPAFDLVFSMVKHQKCMAVDWEKNWDTNLGILTFRPKWVRSLFRILFRVRPPLRSFEILWPEHKPLMTAP